MNAADGKAGAAVTDVRRVHAAGVEVQVVGVRAVRAGRPVEAVTALKVQGAIAVVPVAG